MQQSTNIVIEHDISMKQLLRLHNVSNFNTPKTLPKGSYIEIISGNLTTLTIPDGVISCFCEDLNIEEIICPQSLTELYCKNNKIKSLHVPTYIHALDCSYNNITSLTCDTKYLPNLHYLDISHNNISIIPFNLGSTLQTLFISNNPIQQLGYHEIDTFVCDGDYHAYTLKKSNVVYTQDIKVY